MIGEDVMDVTGEMQIYIEQNDRYTEDMQICMKSWNREQWRGVTAMELE